MVEHPVRMFKACNVASGIGMSGLHIESTGLLSSFSLDCGAISRLHIQLWAFREVVKP